MTEIEAFRKAVEDFIERHGMTPTQFGKEFVGDPKFVFQLREGREPRTTMRNRILAEMSDCEAA